MEQPNIVVAPPGTFREKPKPYMICATARSGSTLLCRALWQTGLAGEPREYFQDQRMEKLSSQWKSGSLEDYIARLRAEKSSPNHAFGFKIHFHQFQAAISDDRLDRLFPDLRYLYITRRNRTRQAISYSRAIQTEQWTSEHLPKREPVFNRDQVEQCRQMIHREEDQWEAFFIANAISPLRIQYENLVQNYTWTVLQAMAHIGIELPDNLRIESPPIKRQSDLTSEQWLARLQTPPGQKR